jgi:hypothetical protein
MKVAGAVAGVSGAVLLRPETNHAQAPPPLRRTFKTKFTDVCKCVLASQLWTSVPVGTLLLFGGGDPQPINDHQELDRHTEFELIASRPWVRSVNTVLSV